MECDPLGLISYTQHFKQKEKKWVSSVMMSNLRELRVTARRIVRIVSESRLVRYHNMWRHASISESLFLYIYHNMTNLEVNTSSRICEVLYRTIYLLSISLILSVYLRECAFVTDNKETEKNHRNRVTKYINKKVWSISR